MSYTKLNIKELQNRLDAISEEHSITTRHGSDRESGELFDQEMFNLSHAMSQVAQKLLPKMKAMDLGDSAKFHAYNNAAKYYGYDLDDEPEDINLGAYDNLDDSDRKKFMANYEEPPVVNPDILQPDLFDDESVEKGDAELAELKDMLGRSGVMGFKN